MKQKTGRLTPRLLWMAIIMAFSSMSASAAVDSANTERILIVGGDHDYAPYESLNRRGNPVGFNIDLMRALADVLNVKVEFRLGLWEQARADLEAGRIDVLPMIVSADRGADLLFSEPYTIVYFEAYARRGAYPIRSLEDLSDQEVLVKRGGFMHDYLRQHDMDVQLIPVASEVEALRLLAAGKHDQALVSQIGGLLAVQRYHLDSLAPTGPPLLPRGYALAVAGGDTELRDELNRALAIVKSSGRYADIYQRWFGDLLPSRRAFVIVLQYTAPLALLAAAALLWSWLLKRQVKQQTRELEYELNERRQAEKALRRSEAYFRDVTEAASDWIWQMDEQLRFVHLSERFFELTGISPDRVLGLTRWELAAADPDQAKWRQHRDTLEQRLPFRDFIYKPLTPDSEGNEHYFKISGKPIYDDQGNFKGYRGMGTDITEQKHAEEEMSRMRIYLRNIIDSMPSILVVVDPEGYITEWNQAAEKLSSMSWREAKGRFFVEVFPHLETQTAQIKSVIRQGRSSKTQRLATQFQGVTQYVDVMVYPLMAADAIGAVIRLDDVTAQVRIQEMMVQTEKMLSVGGLAAGMAHEINNPLGAILQSAQNILRRISPDLAKNREVADKIGLNLGLMRHYLEQRDILHFLDGIHESGTRAAKIVSDMLTFSRRSELSFGYADLAELLDTAIRLAASDYDLKKKYDFKKIRIKRDYDPALRQIYCDKNEIEQVILNLFRNAAQAMDASTTQKPTITLRTRLESGYACIEVIDNGPGMDEKTRKRVFEPFFTTKEIGVGTGLGLSVSYFIIKEQHKGSLSVESQPGSGTRFSIRLPLQEIDDKTLGVGGR